MTKKAAWRIGFTFLMAISGSIGIGLSISSQGNGAFLMYTIDSNLLNLIVSLLSLAAWVVSFWHDHLFSEQLLSKLSYLATCCLTLTFLIVVLVLGPMMGGLKGYQAMLLTGPMIFNHLLTPLLAISSFILFNDHFVLSLKAAGEVMLPTILYGLVTITLNILGVIRGPYPFLMVKQQSVWTTFLWLVLILAINFGVAELLGRANRYIQRRN
ncbi:hypothetical protein [Liquorilactobacillus sicerae]|uniref:hypothetical protein n=1 Tax=Liquorilactobacillus sicerae TaxID=1416943 RepID=UPI0024818418|nr:hypothetical protein [Liquorilactobacillus sicerae]